MFCYPFSTFNNYYNKEKKINFYISHLVSCKITSRPCVQLMYELLLIVFLKTIFLLLTKHFYRSLGLDFAPRVRFLERSLKEKLKTSSTAPTIASKSSCGLFASSDESDDDGLQEKIKYPSADSSNVSKSVASVNESSQDIDGVKKKIRFKI